MIKIKSYTAAVSAGASGTSIGELSVPEGHQYNVLELNILTDTDCQVKGYIVDTEVIDIHNDSDVDTRRRVVNWELTAGTVLRFYGDNGDGSSHDLAVEVTYDDVT